MWVGLFAVILLQCSLPPVLAHGLAQWKSERLLLPVKSVLFHQPADLLLGSLSVLAQGLHRRTCWLLA